MKVKIFNLKEKKLDMKGRGIRTHDPEDPTRQTTDDLLHGNEII